MVYQVFYWIHIGSYLIWVLAFIGSLFLGFKIRSEEDAVLKRDFMRSERQVADIGTYIGGLGIFISGWAMSSLPSGPIWGWFNIPLYPWLALKQLLFIGILILVGFSIKRSIAFRKSVAEEDNLLSSETSSQWRSGYRISMAIYILVVISIVLGLYKPGLG